MKVSDLINELLEIPGDAEIFTARVFHIGEIRIKKETVNRLINEKENHAFWERDQYTAKRKKKNQLPIVKTKEVYTIQ